MKKLISVMLAVMLVLSTMTFVTVSVSAQVDIPAGAELLYYEDFSSASYAKGVELLGDTTATVTLNNTEGKKVWEFKGGSSAKQSVQIVDGTSQGFDGNALKIVSSDRNNSGFYAYFYPKAGETISFTDPTSDYYGKQLVIEYDVKLNNINEYAFMAYNELGKAPYMKAVTNHVQVRTGPYVSKTGDAAKRNWYSFKNWDASTKTSFKFVIDQTGETHVLRGFQDGALTAHIFNYATNGDNANYGNTVKDYVGEDYVGDPIAYGDLTKLTSRIRPKSTDGTPVTAYLDNIKVYVIDDIECKEINWEGKNKEEFNPAAGLDIEFTSAIDKVAFEKAFKVTATNNVAADNVADAIKDITLTNDNKTAHVAFDFSKMSPETQYYLWLDDEFTSASGALLFTDPNGVSAEEEWKYLDTFTTCKKVEVIEETPVSGTIENYVSGQDETSITLEFSEALSEDVDIATAFVVKDAEQNEVGHPLASFSDDERKVVTLQLHELPLKGGDHTIETVEGMVYSAAGIPASYSYDFNVLPFTADYEAEVTGYKPGTEQNIEISLSYPLNDATIDNISKAFLVRNQDNSSVSGLGASVAEGGKKIVLSLQNLDIDGGNYVIASKPESIVNINGEALADVIVIDLLTSATADVIIGENTGVATGSGTDLEVPYTYDVLLDEDFDNAGYVSGTNWITDSSAIPEKFGIKFVGTGALMPGSSVSIVEDPVNPENKVLKNVAGTDGSSGGVENHHIVKRNLDSGAPAEFDTSNEDLVVKMSTRVYIDSDEAVGFADDSGTECNHSRIIGLDGSTAYAPKTHANIRIASNTNTVQYNTWMPGSDRLDGGSSTAVKAELTYNEWHTIDLVFGCNNGVPSYQIVVDGTTVTTAGGYFKADYSSISGMLSMLVPEKTKGSCTVYYDDWKMEKINKLKTHVNAAAVEVPEDQDIYLTFTNAISEEGMALILDNNLVTLKEADGTSVDVDLVQDGTNGIKIDPLYGLKYQTTYIVEVKNSVTNDKDVTTYVKDVFGNTFEGLYYSFTTKKALSTTIDKASSELIYDTDYLYEETRFKYNMVLSDEEHCDIIAAVATFGDGNELLGIQYKVISNGDDEETFEFDSRTGTKYIRLYIWEKLSDGSMGRLMQIPDEVTSK